MIKIVDQVYGKEICYLDGTFYVISKTYWFKKPKYRLLNNLSAVRLTDQTEFCYATLEIFDKQMNSQIFHLEDHVYKKLSKQIKTHLAHILE